jgi:hypothetical protein
MTGGAEYGIQWKYVFTRAKIAVNKITIRIGNSDLCIIKLQRKNGVEKVNSHDEQSGG